MDHFFEAMGHVQKDYERKVKNEEHVLRSPEEVYRHKKCFIPFDEASFQHSLNSYQQITKTPQKVKMGLTIYCGYTADSLR